jgi:hypothetical protein
MATKHELSQPHIWLIQKRYIGSSDSWNITGISWFLSEKTANSYIAGLYRPLFEYRAMRYIPVDLVKGVTP